MSSPVLLLPVHLFSILRSQDVHKGEGKTRTQKNIAIKSLDVEAESDDKYIQYDSVGVFALVLFATLFLLGSIRRET